MEVRTVKSYASMTRGEINDEMHRRVVAHCKEWALDPDDARQYVAGFRAVLMNEPELARAYAGIRERPRPGRGHDDPAAEVDRRTRERMRERGIADYGQAMRDVLDEDEDLKQRYVWRR